VFRQQSRVFCVQTTVTCCLCSGNSHVFPVFRQKSRVFCVQATVTCLLCSGNSHVFAGVLSFVPDGREYFWPSKEGNSTTFFICFLFILHHKGLKIYLEASEIPCVNYIHSSLKIAMCNGLVKRRKLFLATAGSKFAVSIIS
jgi:hypothetical protein